MAERIITSKRELINMSMDDIPDERYWDLGDGNELGIHRIHAYPAKFPSFIPTKAIEYAKSEGKKINRISDIFCGCGTVAVEARVAGIDFWGCDINPVATLIARTKSTVYDKDRLEESFQHVCSTFDKKKDLFANTFYYANERLAYWYKEKQYCDLAALLNAIREVEDGSYRMAFECIFSSILKSTSMWLTKSIKPQIDPYKEPEDVYSAFKQKFNVFCKVMLPVDTPLSEVKIETANFLRVNNVPQADLIVTSPPYVTSYEYADLHQLSALWLGYVEDYKALRAGTIGSMTPDEGNYLSKVVLNEIGDAVVEQLKSCVDIQNSRIRAVKRYYMDMQRAAQKSYQMLSSEGIALFVIGDTEYKGVRILNCKHLAYSLLDAGFSNIRICKRQVSKKNLTPYRDEKGKFCNDKKSRKVYHEEFIVIGRKAII